jgi:hypothetical protein
VADAKACHKQAWDWLEQDLIKLPIIHFAIKPAEVGLDKGGQEPADNLKGAKQHDRLALAPAGQRRRMGEHNRERQ